MPFVAKATGVAFAKVAVRTMLGHSLASMRDSGLIPATTPRPTYVSVKEAVLPFNRFPSVDTVLVESTLCLTAASRKRIVQHRRGDLPGEAPAILAPTARTFLAAVADDRVPVAIRLFLIVRRDLKGKGLGVRERRAGVETQTGNAHNGELHRQHIALLAAG